MKSVQYLQQVQKKYGLKNDIALAAKLNLTRSAISLYKSEKRIMDDETCLKIAIALQMNNPVLVLMAAGTDRAKKMGEKSLWTHFSRRIKREIKQANATA